MNNLSVVLLLALSGICAAVNWPDDVPSELCANGNVSTCPYMNCTCAMYYTQQSECQPYEMNATYEVAYTSYAENNCSDYFNESNIGSWSFAGFSHSPNCNIADNCCNRSQVQDYFNVTGLNSNAMFTVTNGYPYVSVIAEYLDGQLAIGVSVLQLCSNNEWVNVSACGKYFSANDQNETLPCADCSNYYFGCFSFTLISTSERVTPSPSTSMARPTTTTTREATTTRTPSPTAAGSTVTHCLGLMVSLLAVLQFFRAILP